MLTISITEKLHENSKLNSTHNYCRVSGAKWMNNWEIAKTKSHKMKNALEINACKFIRY